MPKVPKEKDTEQGNWAKVDHSTLPEGVKYISTSTKEVFDGKATTTEETIFVGRSLGGSVQLNLKAIQQLIERVETLETEKALGNSCQENNFVSWFKNLLK